jgi:UDP-glucose 4-epimerase
MKSRGLPVIGHAVPWDTESALDELGVGLQRLIENVSGGPWQVVWCAGASVTHSTSEALRGEAELFEAFLDRISALPRAVTNRGALFYASSAGAVYAGGTHPPFTEGSPTAPIGAYGESKLRCESAAASLAEVAGVRVFVGRIANLYGPGQNLEKRQGLISALANSWLTHTPLLLYVPLDTLRDYLYVDDCARLILAGLERLQTEGHPGECRTKILCSGQAVSVGAVIGGFNQISHGRAPVVTRSTSASALQSPDLRLRSTVWSDLDTMHRTGLTEGIGTTLHDLRRNGIQPGVLRPIATA